MTGMVFPVIIVLALVVLSLRERVYRRQLRDKDWASISEPRTSPLTQALTNLIGVAGGIYLTLVMLVAFLELQLPTRVQVAGLSLEPLAALSFGLALLQPYLHRVIDAWRKV